MSYARSFHAVKLCKTNISEGFLTEIWWLLCTLDCRFVVISHPPQAHGILDALYRKHSQGTILCPTLALHVAVGHGKQILADTNTKIIPEALWSTWVSSKLSGLCWHDFPERGHFSRRALSKRLYSRFQDRVSQSIQGGYRGERGTGNMLLLLNSARESLVAASDNSKYSSPRVVETVSFPKPTMLLDNKTSKFAFS